MRQAADRIAPDHTAKHTAVGKAAVMSAAQVSVAHNLAGTAEHSIAEQHFAAAHTAANSPDWNMSADIAHKPAANHMSDRFAAGDTAAERNEFLLS